MSQIIAPGLERKPRRSAAERKALADERLARRTARWEKIAARRATATARAVLRSVRIVYLYAGYDLGTIRITKEEARGLIDKLGPRLVATSTGCCAWLEVSPF